jgi:hypothetical protein
MSDSIFRLRRLLGNTMVAIAAMILEQIFFMAAMSHGTMTRAA